MISTTPIRSSRASCATTARSIRGARWTARWCRWSSGPALALGLSGPAFADDRVEHVGECHPPVISSVEGDWQREALRFRETSLRSLARALGEEPARRQWLDALQLAATTRIGAVEVVHLTRELVLRGLRGAALEAARASVLDVRTALGEETSGRLTRILGAVAARGTLLSADLRELDDIVAAAAVQDALGRRLSQRGSREQAPREQVAQRLQAGIEVAVAMPALAEAVTRQLGGDQPGDVARGALAVCVGQMTKTCPRKEAEAHCQSTPPAYLALLRRLP